MKQKNLIIVSFILFIFVFIACSEVTTSDGLVIGSSNFNRINEYGEFESVPDKMFEKGEVVYLMLFNVSGFEKGEDGLNMVEMDIKITSQFDSLIFEQKEMLGESGHLDLEDNIAINPQTSFAPTSELGRGNYQFFVNIYDKVSGKSATISKGFSYK